MLASLLLESLDLEEIFCKTLGQGAKLLVSLDLHRFVRCGACVDGLYMHVAALDSRQPLRLECVDPLAEGISGLD